MTWLQPPTQPTPASTRPTPMSQNRRLTAQTTSPLRSRMTTGQLHQIAACQKWARTGGGRLKGRAVRLQHSRSLQQWWAVENHIRQRSPWGLPDQAVVMRALMQLALQWTQMQSLGQIYSLPWHLRHHWTMRGSTCKWVHCICIHLQDRPIAACRREGAHQAHPAAVMCALQRLGDACQQKYTRRSAMWE